MTEFSKDELVIIILAQRRLYADVLEKIARIADISMPGFAECIRNIGLETGIESIKLFNPDKALSEVRLEEIKHEKVKLIEYCHFRNQNHSYRGTPFCLVCGYPQTVKRRISKVS